MDEITITKEVIAKNYLYSKIQKDEDRIYDKYPKIYNSIEDNFTENLLKKMQEIEPSNYPSIENIIKKIQIIQNISVSEQEYKTATKVPDCIFSIDNILYETNYPVLEKNRITIHTKRSMIHTTFETKIINTNDILSKEGIKNLNK